MIYKEWINKLKKEWIGKVVCYENTYYKVIDVDYNGFLLINKPLFYSKSYTSNTTAISINDITH